MKTIAGNSVEWILYPPWSLALALTLVVPALSLALIPVLAVASALLALDGGIKILLVTVESATDSAAGRTLCTGMATTEVAVEVEVDVASRAVEEAGVVDTSPLPRFAIAAHPFK
jgi:hypothetical protein